MYCQDVALRKESVDRNIIIVSRAQHQGLSLSARRAWIEILVHVVDHVAACVALRKESVDRNCLRLLK